MKEKEPNSRRIKKTSINFNVEKLCLRSHNVMKKWAVKKVTVLHKKRYAHKKVLPISFEGHNFVCFGQLTKS